jgi:hypothetical protein
MKENEYQQDVGYHIESYSKNEIHRIYVKEKNHHTQALLMFLQLVEDLPELYVHEFLPQSKSEQ